MLIIFVFVGISSGQSINNVEKKDFNTDILLRIDSDTNQDLFRTYEVVGASKDKWTDIIVKKDQLDTLNIPKSKYEILIKDVNSYDKTVGEYYHTFSEMESFLTNIATTYQDITYLSSIGKSYENRDIWLIEISDNPGIDEDEPGVFFMGLHHAREWPSLEICLNIIEELTNSYDSDPKIKNIVDNRRIFIVPCVNPDGYVFSHDEGNDWRKNRHEFLEFSSIGVDLNRNYAGSSNGDPLGSWATISGSVSKNYNSEVYCGPDSISELETQTVKEVFLNYDLCSAISYHTYGEMILWPWGYSTQKVTPDNEYLSQVGTNLASKIGNQEGYGTYAPMQSSELYPTTGDTTDWAYGYYHYILGKPMFAYTVEACSSFHPSSSYLEKIVNENFDGALYLLNEAENINNITPRVTPPNINQIEILSENNIEISWEETNLKANPCFFKLQELSDYDITTDNAEQGSDNWILEGFYTSSDRSESGRYSYYGANKQGRVFTMTSKYPIPISDNMALSFSCNYEVTENKNFAYLEVSKEGRYFEILDSFTGCSNGWIQQEYDLNDYDGQSLYIRLRVSGDSFDMGSDGFYFDDIYPVSDFDKENIISDEIYKNYFELNNKEEGTYFYRVKGYNEEHGWGDYSTLEKIQIGNNHPFRPSRPVGEKSGEKDVEYTYSTSTTDPQGEDLYYLFDWGDDTDSGWLGPYESGETVEATKKWNESGGYIVKVKAKNVYGLESPWSESLSVSMPKEKSIFGMKIIEILKNLNIFDIFLRYLFSL